MPANPTSDLSSERLVQLMRAVGPSLALYIQDSSIWSRPGAEEIKLAIADLCSDLKSLFDRAGMVLDEQHIRTPQVKYPLRYTALHDIELEYLLPQLRQETQSQIALVGSWGDTAGDAGDVLKEARTSLQSHLDVLEQLAAKLVSERTESAKPSAST